MLQSQIMPYRRLKIPRPHFIKSSFFRLFLFFIYLSLSIANAQGTSCALPPTTPSKEFQIMPADCTLNILKLDKDSFVLITDRTPKRDYDTNKRFVGIPKKGLIIEALPDGKVFSLRQTTPWQSQDKAESFDALMKKEFLKSPKIIRKVLKKGPPVIGSQEQRQEQP